MQVIEFLPTQAQSISLFNSVWASSVSLGHGHGETHVYCIYLEPGGEIGAHQAGYGQLFLVVNGSAWAASEDGHRVGLNSGQGAYFAEGEMHSKGSTEGATAIMVQVSELSAEAGRLVG
jgi:quercetin dioxygenase-like cupin family protein